jgi:hypothetical protein
VGAARDVRGREIRLLDYIEGVGQPLGFYANELRRRGWKNSVIYLPRDGVAHNNISGKRYIDHWVEAKGQGRIFIRGLRFHRPRLYADREFGGRNGNRIRSGRPNRRSVELVEAIDSVDFGKIGPDYGDDPDR